MYNYLVTLSNIRNGGTMIDENLRLIIYDILCHTREMLRFFKSIKNLTHTLSLMDLVECALSTQDDIQNSKHYILDLKIKFYDTLIGSDFYE